MAIIFKSIDAATTQVTGETLDLRGLVYGPNISAIRSGTSPNTAAVLEGSLDGVSWFTIRTVFSVAVTSYAHVRYVRARLTATPDSGKSTSITIVVAETPVAPYRVLQLLDNVSSGTTGPEFDLVGVAVGSVGGTEDYSLVATSGTGVQLRLEGSVDGVFWFEVQQQPSTPMFRYVRCRAYQGSGGVSAQLAVVRLS